MNKKLNKKSALINILEMVFVIFLIMQIVYSSNYPIEIINIKPANTGDPAISQYNRIFKAYPGIEYNIRAAVIGRVLSFQILFAKCSSKYVY